MEDKADLIYELSLSDHLAARVDQVFKEHIALINQVGVRVATILFARHEALVDGPEKTICVLLLNAMTSLMAALELMRRGFPLQVGILVRNAIEVMATAAVINSDGKAYQDFKHGKLNSSAALAWLRKLGQRSGGYSREHGETFQMILHMWVLYIDAGNWSHQSRLTESCLR